MPYLRQSTAQTVRFGPFLDITDGVTEEVALTITPALRRLSKDGGAFGAASGAVDAIHDSDGWYSASLTTTDTNTVGELILNVQVPATHLPVWMRWWVLEEAVYDAIFGAAAALAMGSVTGAVGSVTTKTGYSLLATTGLGNQTANITGNLSGSVGTVTLLSADAVAVGSIQDAAITAAKITALSSTAWTNIGASALGIIPGTAVTGTLNTTTMTSDLSGYLDDELIDRWIIFTGGTAAGQGKKITDYAAASGTVTYDTLITAPLNNDTFVIV